MKVIPKTKEKNQVNFSKLKAGETFLWHGGIWIKGEFNQSAINLKTGEMFVDNCGEYVVPVEATVNWKHKEIKKKGKK